MLSTILVVILGVVVIIGAYMFGYHGARIRDIGEILDRRRHSRRDYELIETGQIIAGKAKYRIKGDIRNLLLNRKAIDDMLLELYHDLVNDLDRIQEALADTLNDPGSYSNQKDL